MRLAVSLLLGLLCLSTTLTAQQDPTPTFRAGVDLLTVEATVLSKEGRAIADLQPADFSVTVGGQPRKVLFARFYSADTASATTSTIVAREDATVAAAVDNASRPPGRVVVFVVDRESIRGGTEAAFLDSAISVLKALGPEDAAGAVGLPDSTVSLTRDHVQVTETLRRMTGTMPWDGYRWTLSFAEATEIEKSQVVPGWGKERRGDNRVLDEVYERECRGAVLDGTGGIKVPEGCDKSIITQANEMLLKARTHAREVLGALTNLATGLKRVRGPKRLVFVSGGLRFDQTLIADFETATRTINAAGISLDTIHLDTPPTDATTMRRATTDPYGGRDMSEGLTTMSGMTGGAFFYGVGRAVGVFDRIATEVANFYELGLETVPADADRTARDVEVKVNRPDVSVRARRQVALPAAPRPAASGADAVLELLRQPTEIADLRLVLSNYTMRGAEASLLKLMMSAHVDAPQARAPVTWVFIVTLDGNVVANARQTLTTDRPWTVTTSAKLAQGTYRVRFAAVDADGRAGVLDVPMTVGLHQAGPLQTSDAVVGAVIGDRLQPRATVERGSDGVVMIELMSADPDLLAQTVAILNIIPGGSADPVQRYRMAVQSSSTTAVLIAEGRFRTATLAPGRYTASVVTLVANQPVGRVSRVFDVR